MTTDELLTPVEVREMLKVSRVTLWRWAEQGVLTPVRLSSRTFRYRRSDVDRLLAAA